MADIEIVYQIGYCDSELPFYDEVCQSEMGDEIKSRECSNYNDGSMNPCHIPYGNCIHAKYHYCYKGSTTKKYAIYTNCYDRVTESIPVTINNKTYECKKVKLNGKCIFNEFDDEKEVKEWGE